MWCGDRGVTHKSVKRKNDFSFWNKNLGGCCGLLVQASQHILADIPIIITNYIGNFCGKI